MRVTFVLPGISLIGGVRVVFEYANRLQERGHEVNIVYPFMPYFMGDIYSVNKFKNKLVDIYLNTYRLFKNKKSCFSLKVPLIRVPTLGLKYIKYIENKIPDADIIIATSWETAYSVNKLSMNKGRKLYFIQHYEIWDLWSDEHCWELLEELSSTDFSLSMADISPKRKNLKLFKELVDNSYKLPLEKVTISTWLKQIIEIKLESEVKEVIPNAVDDIFYKEVIFDSNTHKIKILMPYRSSRWKGSKEGIEAFKMIKERCSNVEFIMYGPMKGKEIPSWINFYESISDEELRRLYNIADIFVYPSWVEGFGLPPMEAMACGCAVVTTNVGGIPDYSISGSTVITVPVKNPQKLSDSVIKLIENEYERKQIAEAGLKYVQRFTWNEATDKFEGILIDSLKK